MMKMGQLSRPAGCDPVGWLLFNALVMVSESEPDLIRTQTREGMQLANAEENPLIPSGAHLHLLELRQQIVIRILILRRGWPNLGCGSLAS